MFRRILILSLLACSLCGCVKEDTDDCGPGLRLQFRYTYNNQGQDQLAAEVRDIRIYLFDRTTGLLADIIRPGREDIARGWIEPDIAQGEYTVVAWAGSGEDMTQGGYHDAQMTDPATHTYIPQASVGVTTLDNFRMMLASEALPAGPAGEVCPATEQFCDLFFALAPDISVAKGKNQTVEFDFIKNTSTLKVRVTGLEYLSTRAPAAGQPLHVFAVAPNERYGYDNAIGGDSRVVRYEPPYTALTASAMDVDIKVQRLDIEYHAARPALLYIQNPSTGQDMVTPIDVTDAILKARDAQGNLIWRTQEDIDRENEFPFEISILHDLSVKVTVNGFEIVDTDPNIGRD